jgi:quercetin dioxygenase-like cupin family protein
MLLAVSWSDHPPLSAGLTHSGPQSNAGHSVLCDCKPSLGWHPPSPRPFPGPASGCPRRASPGHLEATFSTTGRRQFPRARPCCDVRGALVVGLGVTGCFPWNLSNKRCNFSVWAPALRQTNSSALVRVDHLEVFRLVLVAGKTARDHKASDAITIQCPEGKVELEAHGRTQILRAGDVVYLSDAEPHAVKALEDSSLLVTVLLRRA